MTYFIEGVVDSMMSSCGPPGTKTMYRLPQTVFTPPSILSKTIHDVPHPLLDPRRRIVVRKMATRHPAASQILPSRNRFDTTYGRPLNAFLTRINVGWCWR
jgi:hypothetical protein